MDADKSVRDSDEKGYMYQEEGDSGDGNLQLAEGELVKLIVEYHSIPKAKGFREKGLIAELTANPIEIEDFQPLTREEANERW